MPKVPRQVYNVFDILKKKLRMKLGTALTGLSTTFVIYYTSSVLPPLNLSFSQYGIDIEPFI